MAKRTSRRKLINPARDTGMSEKAVDSQIGLRRLQYIMNPRYHQVLLRRSSNASTLGIDDSGMTASA